MAGWILSALHRYVTDLIVSSDSTTNGHFSDYHRFFSQSAWDIDHLWNLIAISILVWKTRRTEKKKPCSGQHRCRCSCTA